MESMLFALRVRDDGITIPFRPAPAKEPTVDGVELLWPGKRREPPTLPAAHFTVRESHGDSPGNRLLHGDARAVLTALAADHAGGVDLIAIDPPFATGRDFHAGDDLAYSDRLPPATYLQLLRDIFALGQLLLRPTGSLYVHLDYRAAPYARLLLDEVFGADNLQNEIVWAYATGGRTRRTFPAKHDTILAYRRGDEAYFDAESVGIPRAQVRRNHMKREVDEHGRAYRTIRSAGKVYRYYDDDRVLPPDVWSDIAHLQQKDPERTGYPTQKPERLLERIIRASCPPGGLVVDCFCGSGTTPVVAEKLGRRWIAGDAGEVAIETTRRRLLGLAERRAFTVEALSLAPHETGPGN
jgi:site-specific DNA-methyltransferase (adenine-specific)/adenine-specific DNA-methyltransferase